ncbi:MAG: hypothetical protein IPJ75_11605 [Ignavibacteriales bacterium]|nr:hypothetical protein [Ignavibacteriales bacterium]
MAQTSFFVRPAIIKYLFISFRPSANDPRLRDKVGLLTERLLSESKSGIF